jgi:hypothetical protein
VALGGWALAALGFGRAGREGRPTWLLLMPVLSMNVLIAFLCALGRYSIPILPLLMLLAAFGVDTFLTRRFDTEPAIR